MARSYRVLVDGEERARLALGQDVELRLDEGEHAIQVQIDWCLSRPFLIEPGRDEVWLVIRPAGFFDTWRVFFAPSTFLRLETEPVPTMEG